MKSLTTIVFGSICVLASTLTLAGCGQKSAATSAPPSAVPSAIATTAVPSLIDQADADFKAHSWDVAISDYKTALNGGLPHGAASTHGTDLYVRHQISLAHEYSGLAKQDAMDYDGSTNEFRSAVASEPSNADAKRLLRDAVRRQKSDTAEQANVDQDVVSDSQSQSLQQDTQQRPQQEFAPQQPPPTPEQQQRMAGSLAYDAVYGPFPNQSESDSRWRALCRQSGVGDPDEEERQYIRLSRQKQQDDSNPQPPMNLMGN